MKSMRYENEIFEDKVLKDESLSDAEFVDCIFKNCSVDGVIFNGVSFYECRFIGSKIVNPGTRNTKMSFCEFSECSLVGVHFEDLKPAGSYSLPIKSLTATTLKYCSFDKLEFRRFDFSGNNMIYTTFNGCDLKKSSFEGCDLNESVFMRCDLRECIFDDAHGFRIDVKENKLEGASFSYPEVNSLLYSLGIKIK